MAKMFDTACQHPWL